MIGVPGTAERAFQALKLAGVSVVMILQGSSEQSICCVIREHDGEAARKAVLDAFTRLTRSPLSSVFCLRGRCSVSSNSPLPPGEGHSKCQASGSNSRRVYRQAALGVLRRLPGNEAPSPTR